MNLRPAPLHPSRCAAIGCASPWSVRYPRGSDETNPKRDVCLCERCDAIYLAELQQHRLRAVEGHRREMQVAYAEQVSDSLERRRAREGVVARWGAA